MSISYYTFNLKHFFESIVISENKHRMLRLFSNISLLMRFDFKFITFHYSLKTILIVIIFYIPFSGFATKYYVSNTGNDSNSGTSEERPWRTIEKVNSFMKFSPGDEILFKRGDEWTGTISVRISGNFSNSINYNAYGTGENPKIYGSAIITGWSLYAGNIYKTSFNKNITQLFINNERAKVARYPNFGYYLISSIQSSSKFSSNDLDESVDYSGSKWIGRTNPWILQTKEVIESTFHTLSLNSAPEENLGINEGFFLCNKLEFLDSPGEWFYDRTTKTLYLWTLNGDSPSNYVVRGTITTYGINMGSNDFITVNNISFLHHNTSISASTNSDYNTIKNCLISYPDGIGIETKYVCDGWTIENNEFEGMNHYGIFGYLNNSVIEGNTLRKIALFSDLGITGMGEGLPLESIAGKAIHIEGNANIISYNEIFDVGYSGIAFYGKNNMVEYNYIKNVCLVKDDGGGIYTYTKNPNNPENSNSLIRSNIIDGVPGNIEGTIQTEPQGFGIYLDENSGNIIVDNNTITNIGTSGIFLHQNKNQIIQHNTVFNSLTGIHLTKDNGINKITNNIFYASNYNNRQIIISERFTNINQHIFNFNAYVSHYKKDGLFLKTISWGLPPENLYSFLNWKILTNQDANSTIDVSKLAVGEKEALFYNETKQTIIYHLGSAVFRDVFGKIVKDTFSLKPFTSKILIGKEFNKINKKPEIPDQTFNIVSPKQKNDTIGVVYATEPDSNQVLTYSVLDKTEDFAIHPLTGSLFLISEINTSKNKTVEIIVRVADNSSNSLSDSAKITIHITGTDISPPVINSFTLPDSSYRLKVPISEFIASDDLGITGYYISQTPEIKPQIINWLPSPPEYFTFSAFGENTVYAWAKDSAGNISEPLSMSSLIIEPDLSPQSSVYLFEEASGNLVIDSMELNNGIIINQVYRTIGANGNGVEFNGQGYIDLGKCFGESVKNEFSISLWIKPTSLNGIYQPVITHAGSAGDIYGIYLHPETKGIEFKTLGTTESSLIINNIDSLWDGQWHHLTVVYNGSEKTIYLDNIKLTSKQISGEIDDGWKYNLFIGAGNNNENSATLFHGFIDEVRVFNYALNNQQIQELFHPTNRLLKRITVNEYVSICSGQNYNGWSESGVYERILKRIPEIYSNADSTVLTHLNVNPNYKKEIAKEICEGEVFLFGDTELSATGIYTEIFKSITGCDSTIILNLTVNPSFQNEIEAKICEGETYQFNNQILTETGIYSEKKISITGCDSTTTLALTIIPDYNIVEEVTISPTGNYLGWTIEGIYQRNLVSTTGCDSIVTTILNVNPVDYQKIQLDKGWNIISSYLIPVDRDMEFVMESIRANKSLIKVVDENNNAFEHESTLAGWINKIGSFQIAEGYKVKMEFQDTLEIAGFSVNLPVSVEIKKGINIVSFPYNTPVNALSVMKELINDGIVDKIQDEKGNAIEQWDGLGWINGIGNFTPGHGYVIHANNFGVLTINNAYEKAGLLLTNIGTDHFHVSYEGNGLDHMNINIAGLNETSLNIGDEIAVFDQGICVGAIKLSDLNFEINAVSIPASAADSDGKDGFLVGNSIGLKVWFNKTKKEFTTDFDLIKGKMVFDKQASVFLRLKGVKSDMETLEIFPNPSNEIINIIYPYQNNQMSEISVFDATGRKILSRIAQSNPETVNISSLPAGSYFVKVKTNNKEVTEKFIKIQ